MIPSEGTSLLGLPLIGHGLYRFLDRLLVTKELHGDDGLQLLVQLVHEGDACWEVTAHDLLVRHVVQVLHNSPQRVSVSGYQYFLARLELGNDNVVPVGQSPLDGQLEGLASRELGLCWSVLVPRIIPDDVIIRVIRLHGRRRNVEGSPPDLDLLLPVLGSGLGLIEARQTPVVSLIQPPCFLHSEVGLADLLRTVWRVTWALVSNEVWATSNLYPASASALPPAVASSTPLALRPASYQPQKLLAWFHSLSPWRIMTIL